MKLSVTQADNERKLADFKMNANIIGERMIDGRQEAAEEIISLFQHKIYTIAFRFTGDRDEAFDLSQEIFLRIYAKKHLYKRGTDFNAWVLRLAVNTSINYKSKVVKNPSFSASEINESTERISNDESQEDESTQKKLNDLLARLPKRERLVLIMQIIEERKVSEIADILGTTIKSTEALLTRARKRLRNLAEKNEGL